MKKRWMYSFISSVFVLSLGFLLRGTPREVVSAQGDHKYYFPLIFTPTREGFDDFEDNDPQWIVVNRARWPEAKDGTFRHTTVPWFGNVLRGEIRDNAARLVASPPWLPRGDLQLDVDARFLNCDQKSLDGLGLVFGGNSDFSEYYTFMLACGEDQHFWAILRVKNYVTYSLDRDWWMGAPPWVNAGNGWNHLRVRRIGDRIYLYVNDQLLTGHPYDYYTDSRYVGERRVGLVITSYEMNYQNMDFDNFGLQELP